jgi:hypothetical protein
MFVRCCMSAAVRSARSLGSRSAVRRRDSFVSPEGQRAKITGWAKPQGVTIGAWHEDLDVSGGKITQPGLDLLLARFSPRLRTSPQPVLKR